MTWAPAVHGALAAAHLAVVVGVLRGRQVPGARLVAVVAALLVVDNAVLAVGALVGEGPTLRGLNLVRFVGHALLTPLLVVTARALTAGSGVRRAGLPAARRAALAVTALLVVAAVATDLRGLELVPITEGGILRYHDPTGGPPVAAILTLVLVIVLAVPLGRAGGGWGLLAGAIAMLVASGIDPLVPGPIVGNAGEAALLLGLGAAVRTVRRREGAGAGA